MKIGQIIFYVILVLAFAAGVGGVLFHCPALRVQGPLFLSLGLIMAFYLGLKRSYYRSGNQWAYASDVPDRLEVGFWDYIKALICWADSFRRTYAVEPGLYYTGSEYDKDSPLLVTANYQLTVFLLARKLGHKNVRLLVIDTDGINVWCAAGKGTFCNDAIFEQLGRYDESLLKEGDRLRLVLPKLCFAGVDLPSLRKAGYDAVIGPVYDKDLPAYLLTEPLEDRDTNRVVFGMRSRLFTVVPGLVQLMKYCVILLVAMWLVGQFWSYSIPAVEIIGLVAGLGVLYPVLFPYLPGKWFATKGFWLGVGICFVMSAMAAGGLISLGGLIVSSLFTLAGGMYFGQSYSGNSAVSNMTSIRKETARLLPVYVLLYLVSLAAFVAKEVL